MVRSRFQPVVVPEPSIEETYEILQGLRERYEAHHKLRYADEALMAAAKYSSQYISDRFLPDKVRARTCGGCIWLHGVPRIGVLQGTPPGAHAAAVCKM